MGEEEELGNIEVDIGEALGATSDEISSQVLSLYIPNKDKKNKEFGTQRKWLLEAAGILAEIGGGFTIMPPVEGGWVGEAGVIIFENPVVIYTYVKPEQFIAKLPALREFLHRMGRETNQGEVAIEFDHCFYRITTFDEPIR
jgi:hypothetical protein